MASRSDRIKNIYRQVIASELVSIADDKEKEELDELAKGLLTDTVVEPEAEPTKQKEVKKEKPAFVPPEELAKELGVEMTDVPKKTPILPHREKERPLRMDLPEEMESTKFTPGEIRGKVCDICGRFNFPAWRKECSHCRRTYKYLHDLVFLGGMPLRQAIEIAGGKKSQPTEEELAGLITMPERLSTKKKYYLTPEQLKEIWLKEGKVPLPEEPEDLTMRYEDKRGLVGVPNRIMMEYALTTKFNVERVDKEVFDPKTGKALKVKDVYYDHEGKPVPLKYREREYFSLQEIARELKLDPTTVLHQISQYNNTRSDKDVIKPAGYWDQLNQAFNWEKSIEPVFGERIKEVYEMFKNTYIFQLSKRKEKLDEEVKNLQLTINSYKNREKQIQTEFKDHPQAKEMVKLSKLRIAAKELYSKISETKDKPEERAALVEKLNKVNEVKDPLEKVLKHELNSFEERMKEIKKVLIRSGKLIEAKQKAISSVLTKARDYITAVGKPGQAPEEIKPADLHKARTGGEKQEDEDLNLEDLATELMGEKKASRVNNLLKLSAKWWEEKEKELKPLPGQTELPFPEYDPFRKSRHEKALKEVMREPTKEEEAKNVIKIRNIMKGRITREEAEDRLEAAGDPLASEEGLTPEQKKERRIKLQKLMLEHPTEDEAKARIESVESRPLPISPKIMEPKSTSLEGTYEDRECPHCGKKKIMTGSTRCSSCGFISAPNRKEVIVEETMFRLVRDKDGNPIPKLDAEGNQMIDARGKPMFKKRPEKMYSHVSIQLDDLGHPKWAQARKVSAVSPDAGGKIGKERELFFDRMSKESPKIREIKPLTKTPEDFRPIFEVQVDEGGNESRVDTGEKEHKQKCRGCPNPWVKVKLEEFGTYPTIENAYKFIEHEQLGNNVRAWMFQDIYQPKEEKTDKPKTFEPTILPTGSSRFEYILKLSKMP